MVEPALDAAQAVDPVAIGSLKRLRVDLIDDGGVPS
jgi:hypothetical protein